MKRKRQSSSVRVGSVKGRGGSVKSTRGRKSRKLNPETPSGQDFTLPQI